MLQDAESQTNHEISKEKFKLFIKDRNSEWHHNRIVVLQNFFPRQCSEYNVGFPVVALKPSSSIKQLILCV